MIARDIPAHTVAAVDPQRMKTMAAVLRDPYPVHWDRAGNQRLGYGSRVVNQGPLNVGYIVNMLEAWAGRGAVQSLAVRFHARVFDGDTVTARGAVTRTEGAVVHCDVWLERGGEQVLSGVAVVRAVLS